MIKNILDKSIIHSWLCVVVQRSFMRIHADYLNSALLHFNTDTCSDRNVITCKPAFHVIHYVPCLRLYSILVCRVVKNLGLCESAPFLICAIMHCGSKNTILPEPHIPCLCRNGGPWLHTSSFNFTAATETARWSIINMTPYIIWSTLQMKNESRIHCSRQDRALTFSQGRSRELLKSVVLHWLPTINRLEYAIPSWSSTDLNTPSVLKLHICQCFSIIRMVNGPLPACCKKYARYSPTYLDIY